MRQMVSNGKVVCNSSGLDLWILYSCSQDPTECDEDIFWRSVSSSHPQVPYVWIKQTLNTALFHL